MDNRNFFSTRLGQATMASVAAMVACAALSTQVSVIAPQQAVAQINLVTVA